MRGEELPLSSSSRRILVLGGARSGKSAFAERLAAECGEPVLYVATATALDDEMTQRIALHRQQRPSPWRTLEAPLHLASRLAAELSLRTAPDLGRDSENGAGDIRPIPAVGQVCEANTAEVESVPSVEDSTSDTVTVPTIPRVGEVSAAGTGDVPPMGRPSVVTVLVEDLTLWLSNLMAEDEGAAEGQALAEVRALLDLPVDVILVSNEVGMGVVPPYPLGRVFRDALGRVNQAAASACGEVYFLVAGLPLRLK